MRRAPGSDTIAAVATAPGRAALAVLRVSGPLAASIGTTLTGSVGALEPRRAVLRRLTHPLTGEALDRAVLTWYPAPGSYTGEDLLEISCHGGAVVPALVMDAMCAAGARPAERGEFTRRAYLNGKLDLLQAEATLDLIDARSTRMSGAALFALERGLSQRIERLRARMIELQALVAYDIDFPEEDDGPVEPARIDRLTDELVGEIDGLLRHAPEGELLREGALTVIAGRPNAGKSSLFNALLGVQRAIVTEEPGTTRDAIEAMLSVDGYPFRLVDTAGIRREAARLESLGIEVARTYLDRADLALVCVEAGRVPDAEEQQFVAALDERIGSERVLVVRTKVDAQVGAGAAGLVSGSVRYEERGVGTAVSALRGEGLETLRKAMLTAVYAGLSGTEEQPLVTRRRHSRALSQARTAVKRFGNVRRHGQPAEIAVTHLQDAVLLLEELSGLITDEDVLDALFASFCVGK